MELGYENQNGIKYSLLKQKLEESGITFGRFLEPAFMKWIGDSFDSDYSTELQLVNEIRKASAHIKEPDRLDAEYRRAYDTFSGKVWVIKGSTVKQYIDYLELKESRESAERAQSASIEANKKSSTSIKLAVVAIAIGLIGTILTFVQNMDNPKTPYDVRVIEDKTKSKELEKENRELKEELFKAEMMVKVLESKQDKTTK